MKKQINILVLFSNKLLSLTKQNSYIDNEFVYNNYFFYGGKKAVKRAFLLCFLWMNSIVFSQQTIAKSFFSSANSVEIYSEGLDELKIVNSNGSRIEVNLFDENPNSHYVLAREESSTLKIEFKLGFLEEENTFRKFITKRLNRASAIVKLPSNKNITIFGTNVDVISKSYNGGLTIYIDKGYVNLNRVQQNLDLRLFQGNVFAQVSQLNIDIQSTKGNIVINNKTHSKNYKKEVKNSTKTFKVFSINANITITPIE